jgi:hypothetical protein
LIGCWGEDLVWPTVLVGVKTSCIVVDYWGGAVCMGIPSVGCWADLWGGVGSSLWGGIGSLFFVGMTMWAWAGLILNLSKFLLAWLK